jgi:hypothetical protein
MSLDEKLGTERKGTSDSFRKANLVQMGKEMRARIKFSKLNGGSRISISTFITTLFY